MNTIDDILQQAKVIEAKLGYVFRDRSLLSLAFTHRSYVNESRHTCSHNERLEFLGDSVLGVIIAEHLYTHFPSTPEGDLSYLRSRLVDANSCAVYIQKLNLSQYILLGKGERMNDGRGRESIMADLLEAIIGAIYLDGGLSAAKKFLFQNFSAEIESIIKTPLQNWKALLQDYCQKKLQCTPIYKVMEETGPDHQKVFAVSVMVQDQHLGQGKGESKKIAQQAAAQDAYTRINPEL